jgi:hypothetical protein
MSELQIEKIGLDRPLEVQRPEKRHEAGFTDTGRLVILCDGVFAIILTLLVLEIHRPNAEPGRLAQELLKDWPSYLAYARGVSLCQRHLGESPLPVRAAAEGRSNSELD